MQLLRAPIRELYPLQNLKKPRRERRREADLFRDADEFHDSDQILDEATNIRVKDYRGVRNGIYYAKIKAAAEKLKANPDSMQVLRDMVK